MVFEELFRYSPRRRASPRIAEGFSPTARGAYRIKCSISISPALPAPCRPSICLRRPPFAATDILGALDSGESITQITHDPSQHLCFFSTCGPGKKLFYLLKNIHKLFSSSLLLRTACPNVRPESRASPEPHSKAASGASDIRCLDNRLSNDVFSLQYVYKYLYLVE
jgi:hypothetical protein